MPQTFLGRAVERLRMGKMPFDEIVVNILKKATFHTEIRPPVVREIEDVDLRLPEFYPASLAREDMDFV